MKIEGENRLWESNLFCLEAGQEQEQCSIEEQDLSLQAKVGFSFILQLDPSFQWLSFLPCTARGWMLNKDQHLAHSSTDSFRELSLCTAQDWAFIPFCWYCWFLGTGNLGNWRNWKVPCLLFCFSRSSFTWDDWGAALRFNHFDQNSHFEGNVVKSLFKIYSYTTP